MQHSCPLQKKMEIARKGLLDLTTRNRLLACPRHRSRSRIIEVVDELADEVFRILVQKGRTMSFLPSQDPAVAGEADTQDGSLWLSQPEEDEVDERGVAKRHTDNRLQTELSSEALQKRLLALYYDARTAEEEQGVSILFLALGFLKWYESDSSDRDRHAPLLLVPVVLDRSSAKGRFKLTYSGDEISTNLSLQSKLREEFAVDIPEVPAIEDLSPSEYFSKIAQAVAGYPRWDMQPNDIVLGLFSFSKFLMYRDLDSALWPDCKEESPSLLNSLLGDGGFRAEPALCGENDKLDTLIQPLDMVHVLDADSSQTQVIEEVKRGQNLVVQGPPGTGKSQTIANIIATAVEDGKTVLFLAEKMAALEVVKRRLDNIGLGDMCLELHSRKSNKRQLLHELKRTLALGAPEAADVGQQAMTLKLARDKLNNHADAIHEPLKPSGLTPFRVIGELVRLKAMGVRPSDIRIETATEWTADEFQSKLQLLRQAVAHVCESGTPSTHPWRGVMLEAVLPMDIQRTTERLQELIDGLEGIDTTMAALASQLRVALPTNAVGAIRLAKFGQRIATAPVMDRSRLADAVWSQHRHDISHLVKSGLALCKSRMKLRGVVDQTAWSCDVADARRKLAIHGRSLFRLMRRDYRQAQSTLRGILLNKAPKSLDARLSILNALILGQKASIAIATGGDLGMRAFGTCWKGEKSDWSALAAIDAWDVENEAKRAAELCRETISHIAELKTVGKLSSQIGKTLKPSLLAVRDLFNRLKLDMKTAFGTDDLTTLSLRDLKARLGQWRGDTESITKWIGYRRLHEALGTEGLGALAQRLYRGQIEPDDAEDLFSSMYYEAVMRKVMDENTMLRDFDGQSHEMVLASFQGLDIERIELARQQVASAHYECMPKGESSIGALGVIYREIHKKGKHLPIRKLVKQSGTALQAIKPVMMMSPISIAQFLEPGAIQFDLLLIDEASQVRPVEALGAVARSGQIVVVGDEKQLPPTWFFEKVLSDDAVGVDADAFQAHDVESILGLCCAQRMPGRLLKWHYRSRHHSLIAVSNREFYDSKLYVVPSPLRTDSASSTLGLHFRYVQDGVFDRGASAANREEARVVAQAVMEHAQNRPSETLGVGAFSVAQRDAILDELERLRRQETESEAFFSSECPEPFFVKNLETIQGDERDVIFISVGYGRDSSGFMSMSFGPLSVEGGERRLNVLITRARARCEVFSSITADDIDLNRARGRGPKAFKAFLSYAKDGILDVGLPTSRGHDSPFEESVARALEAHGYQVDAQVGVAGFFVDLAVIDTDKPGRYLIGIECDGATYHSSRSARDRDRLRQQVLEDRGWIIHRIWSTDWFNRPEAQLRITVAAIDAAKVEVMKQVDSVSLARASARPTASVGGEVVRSQRCPRFSDNLRDSLSKPYIEAAFHVSVSAEIHETPQSHLEDVVTRIVDLEGPVHGDEVARRAASLWGLKRTGSRIQEAVDGALCAAVVHGRLGETDSFYTKKEQREITVRNRTDVSSAGLRRPDMLPPQETRSAILAIARSHMGVDRDEAIIETTRLFGFKATSQSLRKVVAVELDRLLEDGSLTSRNGMIYAESPV